MSKPLFKAAIVLLICLLACGMGSAQRQMELLGRGLLAVRKTSPSSQVYVSWRLLGNDPQEIAFNLYRSANGGPPVKLNPVPLTTTTDFTDTSANFSGSNVYTVKPVMGGVEVPDAFAHPSSEAATLPANPVARQYFPVPIQDTPLGALKVGFCWVGDLDGDGEYDFVIIRHGVRQFLEAYKRDGTFLWRMDMGPNSVNQYNIEPGSSALGIGHGDNATVYDMDGDGMAEVIVRTSNGVVFGNGVTLTAANNNSQFISIIHGGTGAEMARAPLPNPYLSDGPLQGHMGIFYPDGRRPTVLLAAKNRRDSNGGDNGFQGLTTTWDYRDGAITRRWSYDSATLGEHAPEGHQIRLGDLDNDGRDEFLDIGYAIDDDGTQLFNMPEVVHGDRFHLADVDPDRPGLECYAIQQNNGSGLATFLHDPSNGSFIKKWYAGGVVDVGRGLASDIDPNHKGLEMFSTQAGIFNSKGDQIYNDRPFPPEAIWWDGNLSREFLATVGSTAEAPAIARFDPAFPGSQSRIYTIYNQTAPGVYWSYGGRAPFWGDIMGDWREEVVTVANDNSELRIYTTTTAASNRLYTLMHNPQYRIQATTKGYVQASYVDYYLGDGMTIPPPPPMVDAKLVWRGGAGASVWDSGSNPSWRENGVESTFADGDSVRFDIAADHSTAVQLSGTLQPGAVTVYSPENQSIDGSNGSLAGPMKFTKAGAGSLTISGSHAFSGPTTVWDGALILDGSFDQSPVTVWGGTWGGVAASGLTGGRIAGTGTFNQVVTVRYRGAVTPGAGIGVAGTLAFGNGLAAEDGAGFAMDLSDDPAGIAKANDRIEITGNLTLAGKVGLVIKTLDGALAPGEYTLITYSGVLTGSASNFDVKNPPGTPYQLVAAGGAVKLIVPVTRAPGPVVWRGNGGIWDLATSQNWLAGGTPEVFVAGDAVTFDATGASSSTVNLTTQLPVASLTVNAASDYTLTGAGSVAGPGGITKSGSGTLTLGTSNSYTGPTTILGGVIAISALGDAGSPGSIGAATASASNLVIDGGTLRLAGAQTSTNRSMTLGAGGGTLEVASSNSSIQISGTVTGGGRLTKSGPGTLILAKNNNYTGGTTIQAGTIYLAGATANSSGLGSGAVTLDGGTLTMADVRASETAAWNLIVPEGGTGRLNADGRCSLTGTLSGAGTFNYYSPYVRTDLKGNWSSFFGRINVISGSGGGEMRVTNNFGYANSSITLGEDCFLYYNITNTNQTLDVGELSGPSTSGLGGGPTSNRTVTWRVGGKNSDAAFDGIIVNSTGTTAITKTGTGVWTLGGAHTYTGATTIAGGTLRVNGGTSGSPHTVQSAAALGGSGTITGNVTFQSGAVLEHGTLGGTPLAITGNLALGTSLVVRPRPGVALSSGTFPILTYTGTLSGTPDISYQPPEGTNLMATIHTGTAGVVTLTLAPLAGTADHLVWTGSSSAAWDTATPNWTDGSSALVFANGATVAFTDAGNADAPVTLSLDVEPSSIIVDAANNYSLTGSGKITGDTSLGKSNTGTLTVTGEHSHTGGTLITGGTLAIGHIAALGTGPVTLSGGTWAMGALTPLNPIIVAANSTITGGSGGGAHGIKAVSGSHTLTLTATNVFDLEGSLADFNGTLFLNGTGSFRLFGASGGSSAGFDLGTRSLGSRSGSAFGLGSLAGAAGSSLGGANGYNSAVTYTIGGNQLNSTFSGSINNGNTNSNVGNITHIVKTGTGTLTLAGTNNHTGTTTISAGKLHVTGSLADTAVTVDPAATLGGSGTIAGAVTCHGTLAPGTSTGTLTLNNGLTLTATSVLDYELGSSPDLTLVTGDLALSGTLQVTPVAGFGPGTFTLISYAGNLVDDDGLQIGDLPDGFEGSISTSSPGLVQLVVTQDLTPFEEWQILHFGSSDHPDAAASADPDGDGTTNETEFRLGLDPKNGVSMFAATLEPSAGGFTITWPTAPGLVFEIRRSQTLDDPWDPLETVVGIGTYTDETPPPGRAYYRIVLLP